MEKIVYALWRDTATDRDAFNARLKDEIAPRLAEQAYAVRINLQDADVANGTSPRMASTNPQMRAISPASPSTRSSLKLRRASLRGWCANRPLSPITGTRPSRACAPKASRRSCSSAARRG